MSFIDVLNSLFGCSYESDSKIFTKHRLFPAHFISRQDETITRISCWRKCTGINITLLDLALKELYWEALFCHWYQQWLFDFSLDTLVFGFYPPSLVCFCNEVHWFLFSQCKTGPCILYDIGLTSNTWKPTPLTGRWLWMCVKCQSFVN